MEWPIHLTGKPTIAQMAVATHGLKKRVEFYRLPTLWCIHIYRYHADIVVDGTSLEVHPGSVTVFPPGVTLEYRLRGKSVHAYAHFTLPAEARPAQQIPVLQESAVGLNTRFEEAIGWLPTQRFRAEIRLWDILWQLTAPTPVESRSQHPAVTEALRLIELQLSEVLYVGALARTVGLSQNHLTRLFAAATGQTVTAYIRARRVDRAAHLLRHSTLPVKTIAAEVGIADLHLFNKYVRRVFGVPPRRLRTRGRS